MDYRKWSVPRREAKLIDETAKLLGYGPIRGTGPWKKVSLMEVQSSGGIWGGRIGHVSPT